MHPTLSQFATVLVFLVSSAICLADDWKPIAPSELAQKEAIVEKDADAEAFFWEVHVEDALDGNSVQTLMQNYIRIKIFTERGVQSQGTIDVTYSGRNEIYEIAARTIKPDGSILPLKKETIFERTLLRAGGVKVKAKSFAMPGLEPGVIIEYRWKERRPDHAANYMRLQFQREIPIQQVKYFIKPLNLSGISSLGMRSQMFQGQATNFVKEPNGFVSTTMTNVPAFREEPHMPPEAEVRPWMLVYYAEEKKLAPEKFWNEYGKGQYEEYKSGMKVNNDIKKAALNVIGADAATEDQKLEQLFNYCRTNIKNIHDDASGLTPDDLKKIKENKSPADTLKRGLGSGSDIRLLFASMAASLGFETRVALLSNSDDVRFNRSFVDGYFLSLPDIAVRINGTWRFFDPAQKYLPFGMLSWQEEGQVALVTDPKDPEFVVTPISGVKDSSEKRCATLALNEEGTLEGDVTIEYFGHLGAAQKEFNDDDSSAQREETLTERVKERLGNAELTNIQILNVTDPIKPFAYAYHIRIPNYARRTGKRLFFQPAFFEYGVDPMFTTSTRKYPVRFHYPWTEEDQVTIQLPGGFSLESPDSPAPVIAGKLSRYDVRMTITKDRRLRYQRNFYFGVDGLLHFPVSAYTDLKQYFDRVQKNDNHVLTLKQDSETGGDK